MEQKVSDLSTKLGISFNNLAYLHEALTHRSYVNENKAQGLQHNERLEFLGDAVLELATTEYLFTKYADYKEGALTSFRAALVKTESLAEEAIRLGIGEYILMSKGEEATGGRSRIYILANTMEAIIGAIYLDSGYATAEAFITKNISYKSDAIVNERLDIDAKSKLQELAQEITRITPSYVFVGSEGPDHNKTFEMAVYIGDHEFGRGKGKSKQEAEQQAASLGIENWDELSSKYFHL